jgi:hypothetical protein
MAVIAGCRHYPACLLRSGLDIPPVGLVLALGFVPVLIFSWAYELTPDGVLALKDFSFDPFLFE